MKTSLVRMCENLRSAPHNSKLGKCRRLFPASGSEGLIDQFFLWLDMY